MATTLVQLSDSLLPEETLKNGQTIRYIVVHKPLTFTLTHPSDNTLAVFDKAGQRVEIEDTEEDIYSIKRNKETESTSLQIELIFNKQCNLHSGNYYQVQILNNENEPIFQVFVKVINSHQTVHILRKAQK